MGDAMPFDSLPSEPIRPIPEQQCSEGVGPWIGVWILLGLTAMSAAVLIMRWKW
jgi:hypothetical protein